MMRIRNAEANRSVIVVFIVIALVAAAHGVPWGTSAPLQVELRNSLHAPVFTLLSLFLLFEFGKKLHTPLAIAVTASLALLTALLGELTQYFTHGEASYFDLLRDFAGIALGLCIGLVVARQRGANLFGGVKCAQLAIMLFGTILVVSSPARTAWILVNQHRALPNIATFDARWESRTYATYHGASLEIRAAPASWGTEHGKAAYLTMSAGRTSGIEIYPAADWSGYEFIGLSIASGNGRTNTLSLRIDDIGHDGKYLDRFNQILPLNSQKRRIRIRLSYVRHSPAGREMDLRKIRSIIFFAENPTDGESIVLDDIRLERKID